MFSKLLKSGDNIQLVIIDWFGVLSSKGLFEHHTTINETLLEIYDDKNIHEFYSGKRSVDELTNANDDKNKITDFFALQDCEQIKRVIQATKCLFPFARIVIGTDNLKEANSVILESVSDDSINIYNSAYFKTVKSDRLLSIIMQYEDTLPQNCLLIDDSIINCDRMKELGGSYIYVN